MSQPSPADRDRAQRRVRTITMTAAATAGVLTLGGAAVAAGTFSGRTVSADTSTRSGQDANATADPTTGLQPPTSPPTDGSGGSGLQPVTSSGS